MFKTQTTLDSYDIPEPYRGYLSAWIQEHDNYGNNSYFTLDLQDFREYESLEAYVEDYGNHIAQFMQWLCAQTTLAEILVLYSW